MKKSNFKNAKLYSVGSFNGIIQKDRTVDQRNNYGPRSRFSSGKQKNFVCCSQLNGNCGEATNGDDMVSRKGTKKVTTTKRISVVKSSSLKKKKTPKSLTLRKQVFSNTESYRLALTDGFNPKAIGARVPDMYSYPSSTYKLKGTFALQSNASSNCSCILTANPFLSVIDLTTSTIATTQPMYQYTTSNWVYAVAHPQTTWNSVANFRVVGVTYRIRNQLPVNTCTGRMITGTVPTVPMDLSINNLISYQVTNGALLNKLLGFSESTSANLTTGVGTSTILNLPSSKDISLQQIMGNSIQFSAKPVSPDAFDFITTDPNGDINSTQSTGQEALTTSATGALVNVSSSRTLGNGGWDSLLINFEGVPASSTIAYVDYVFHIEGTPQTAQQSATVPVPDTSVPSHVDINGFNSILSKVLTKDNLSLIADIGDSAFGGFKNGGPMGALGSVMQKLILRSGLN
jgi:hypothetical protein